MNAIKQLEAPGKARLRSRYRKYFVAVLYVSILFLVTVFFSEISLQVAAEISPLVDMVLFPSQESILPDAELGYRGNPQFPEHDANGFRNKAVPDTTDIVAIGDSHTYGTSVAFEQAWPQVLEKLTSCRVYSMAVGGYGPLQYMVLGQRAVQFKPRLILVGIYFGNDFYDDWEMYLRNPSAYDVPKELLNKALEREQQNPLSRDVGDFFNMGQTPVEDEQFWSLRSFLARNSALWGFGRSLKNKLFPPPNVLSNDFQTAVAALTSKHLEYVSIFEGQDWRTILTGRYRESVENIDDPRIKVGVWLAKWAIQNIAEIGKQHHIATIFLLLPTKESVFVDKAQVPAGNRYSRKLTTEEEQIRREIIQYLGKNSLVYIDMAPSLRSMVRQPFFENADGHPNAIGHMEIATKLAEHVGTCAKPPHR